MLLVRPVASLLGAEGALLDNCVLYGRICFISMPAFMLQNVFQSFFVTAEKPKLGLGVIIIAGVTNMVLDYLFIAVLGWGLCHKLSSDSVGSSLFILYNFLCLYKMTFRSFLPICFLYSSYISKKPGLPGLLYMC